MLPWKRNQAKHSIEHVIQEVGRIMLRELTPTINAKHLTWDEYPNGRRINPRDEDLADTTRYSLSIITQTSQPVIDIDVAWFYDSQLPVIFIRTEDWSAAKKGEKIKQKFPFYDFTRAVQAAEESILGFQRANGNRIAAD